MKTQIVYLLGLVSATYALPGQPQPNVWNNAVSYNERQVRHSIVTPRDGPAAVKRAEPAIPGYKYIGCKVDVVAKRTLGDKYTWSKNMTYAACSKFCVNYEYIGLEYETECFCGSGLPATIRAANETECGMTCSGDKTAKCGGASRISVFQAKPFTPSTPPKVSGYTYRGCFADAVSKRVLKDGFYYGKNVTTAGCAALCKKSTYFGTEYGGECYCGNTLSTNAVQVDAQQCKAQCVGSTAQACGDANRLTLYWKNP